MNIKIPSREEIAARLQRALASCVETKPQPPEAQCASTGCAYQPGDAPSCRRSAVYTPQVIAQVLSLIEGGCTEKAACTRAGIIANGWAKLKLRHPDIREKAIAAKEVARRSRLEKDEQQQGELRAMRDSAKAARRPPSNSLPKDINLIRYYLATKVPLDLACLDRAIIERACALYGTPFERWLVHEERFRIMDWVYKKRAEIRGERPQNALTSSPEPDNGEHLPGTQKAEVLIPNFKMHPQYGKVRQDSRWD